MPDYRFQVELESVSGLAADRVINTWYARAADDTVAANFAITLTDFYGLDLPGQTRSVGEYFGASVSRVAGAHRIKVYDLADPEPRTPVTEQPFGIQAALVNDDLPREVALCLSFRAEYTSGANRARRRGRVYLGPFNTGALGGPDAGEDSRPLGALVTDVIVGAQHVLSNPTGLWLVWSETDAAGRFVIAGWVDNAWDTQRRRGAAPTVRTLFSDPVP